MANKNWGESFAESFSEGLNNGMRMAFQGTQMAQQERQNQMMMDARMFEHGYERIDPKDNEEELKQAIWEKKAEGYPVAGGGAVGIPIGGKAKDGIIYDAQGNEKGSYTGEAPKPVSNLVSGYGKNIVRIGNLWYKAPDPSNADDINSVVEKLNKSYQGGGSFIPSTKSVGEVTYHYQPSIEEQYGGWRQQNGFQNAPIQQMPIETPMQAPIQSPVSTIQPPKAVIQMRNMVSNAVAEGASLEEILQGIKDEGMNPMDYADLLKPLISKRQTAPVKPQSPYNLINTKARSNNKRNLI